jgi:hypothetical protein
MGLKWGRGNGVRNTACWPAGPIPEIVVDRSRVHAPASRPRRREPASRRSARAPRRRRAGSGRAGRRRRRRADRGAGPGISSEAPRRGGVGACDPRAHRPTVMFCPSLVGAIMITLTSGAGASMLLTFYQSMRKISTVTVRKARRTPPPPPYAPANRLRWHAAQGRRGCSSSPGSSGPRSGGRAARPAGPPDGGRPGRRHRREVEKQPGRRGRCDHVRRHG